MKIAHITATFPPYFGGTGNVALHNARSLAELGHEVTVYTARVRGSPNKHSNGFEVRRLRAAFRIGNAPLLPALLLLPQYDLVHLHYPFIFGAEQVLLLKRLKEQPYVLTYHNDLVAPGAKGALFDLYQRVWTSRVLNGASRVVVTNWDGAAGSPIVGPFVRRRPGRVTEIPNGVDTELFRPLAGGPARERLGLTPDSQVILFVGAMDGAHHPKGGVPVLLEAVARLRDRSVAVLLVGGGDRVSEYSALASSLGLANRFHFTGQIPHEEMPPVFAAADIVVQPSQLFEPFGLVAVEAMACGKPVIVSDLPGVRRVVAEAGGGLLARPGDAADLAAKIDLLLSDSNLRAELGSVGRSGVEAHFDSKQVGPMLVRIYEEVLTLA